jgi:hypothetical protein
VRRVWSLLSSVIAVGDGLRCSSVTPGVRAEMGGRRGR